MKPQGQSLGSNLLILGMGVNIRFRKRGKVGLGAYKWHSMVNGWFGVFNSGDSC